MRYLKFWGRNWLICLVSSVVVALALILITVLQMNDVIGNTEEVLVTWLSLFPYYLFIGGIFVLLVVTVNYFQIFFSVLLSMNCTRRAITGGIVLTNGAVIVTICGIAAAIWREASGDIAASAVTLLPLLAGCLFLECAVLMVIGITILRWGKAGMIVLIALGMVSGGFFGVLVAINRNFYTYLQELSLHMNFYPVLWVCLGLYILASAFTAAATRNAQVRA